MTSGCIRSTNSSRFLSGSLDKLVKTLVDNSQETLKQFKEETIDNDEILNVVKEIENLLGKDENIR